MYIALKTSGRIHAISKARVFDLRKAKIIISLGPASREPDVVERLIAAGANGVRINMSHGTHEEKTVDIERARAAAKKLGQPIAILVDLSGPNIGTGELKDDRRP